MRKQLRCHKHMLIKSTALFVILCMIIGSIYIPAFAEENDGNNLPVAEDGNMLSTDPVNEENKTDDTSKDDKEAKGNIQEEKEPILDENAEGKGQVSDEDAEGKEPVPDENIEGKEPVPDENTGGEEQTPGENAEEKEPETEKGNGDNETVSGNSIKAEEQEEKESSDDEQEMQKIQETPEIPEIINVVVPAAYTLALNPYSLPIQIGENEVTTEQIISGTYGIVNKSSTDQIVKVSLMVEDRNDGMLVFTDSAEEAMNADENVYAVYLAVVPADEEEVLIEDLPVDANVTGEALQNVRMNGAKEQAVTLYAGVNQIAFWLSAAVYSLEDDENYAEEQFTEDETPDEIQSEALDEVLEETSEETLNETPEIILEGLAPGGTGVTAYTFYGVMNPNAAWEELSGGIKISVVYTYQTADGSEEIIEGTGAMINID